MMGFRALGQVMFDCITEDVHRILMPDGTQFVYENEKSTAETAGAATDSQSHRQQTVLLSVIWYHKICHVSTSQQMDLTPLTVTDPGSVPGAAEMVSSPSSDRISQDNGFVNSAPQTPAQMVADFAQTIEGDKGKTAMAGMYRPEQSPTDYIKSMMGVYNAGRQGVPQAQVDTGVLNPQQADAAYAAGQMDAMAEQANAAKAQQTSAPADNTKIPTNSENEQGVTGMNEQNMHDTDGKDGANKPKLLEIGDNDSPAVKTAKRVANILTERFGVEFEMYAADDGMDGHFDPDTKKIYINENAESPMLSVVAHEFLHSFKVMDAAGYNILKRITESDLNLARFNEYKKALLAAYDEKGIEYKHLDPDDLHDLVVEEAMCDLVGEMVNDPTTIERIARHDRGLVQRIMDYLGELIDTIRAHFTESDTEIQKLVDNYEQLKAVYQEVIGTSNARMENVGTVEGRRKHLIKTRPDGKRYVKADRQVLYSNNQDNWGKELENYINEEIRKGRDVDFVTPDGEIITITEDTAWKIGDQNGWTEETFPIKMDMGTHIDELLQVSTFQNNEPARDRTGKRFQADSFDHRVAFFEDFDGKYYRVNISVGVDKNGKTAYSIGKDIKEAKKPSKKAIKKRESPQLNGSWSKKTRPNAGFAPTDSIFESAQKSNGNYNQKRQGDFEQSGQEDYNQEMLRKFQEAGIDVGDAGKKIDLAKGGRAKVGRIAPGQSDAERTKILQSKKIAAPIYSGEADAAVAQNVEGLESRETRLKKAVLKKLADEFQIYGDVYNQDMDIEISVSAGTVNETSNKILTDTKQLAKLLPILNETVQTAVGIETHVNRYYYDDNTRFVHELLGGYIDDEYFVPVRFGVKENNQPGQGNKLYVIIDQEKIKRAEVSEPQPTDKNPQVYGARPAHVISIAQIAKNVKNKDLLRYLPDGMLDSEQKRLKQEGIAETAARTDAKNDRKYREYVEAGNLGEAKNMVRRAAERFGVTENAETVLYDEEGNLVPFSKRFSAGTGKIDLAKGGRAKVFRKGSRGAKAQEMLERYEDSGKSTAALPDMGWARTYRRDAEKMNKYLANQIETAEFELEAGNKTPDQIKALEKELFLCNKFA